MKLPDIPADILRYILSYCPIDGVISLRNCGSSAMNSRISRDVTSLDWKWQTSVLAVWPSFLTSLPNIRDLHATFEDKDMDITIPLSHFSWSRVPTTLVTLELELSLHSIPNSSSAFGLDSQFPSLKTLLFDYSEYSTKINGSLVPNFSLYCPVLEKLRFASSDLELPSLLASTLPRSLTDLDISFSSLCIENKEDEDFEDWYPDWPPSLKKAKITMEGRVNDPSHLPSCTTNIRFIPCYDYRIEYELTEWNLEHLPRDLQVIEFYSYGVCPPLADLPPTALTSIKTGGRFVFFSLSDLPQGLTESNCLKFDPLQLNQPQFPQGLLDIQLKGQLPAFNSVLLNPHLRSLKLTVDLPTSSDTLKEWLESLPPNLRTLEYRSSMNLCLSIPSGLDSALLPRSLTCLSLFHLDMTSNSNLNISDWLRSLPLTLKRLELGQVCNLQADQLSGIRALNRLRYLHLSFTFRPEDRFARYLECLPSTLVTLILGIISREIKTSVQTSLQNSDLALLPRGLVQLQLPPSPELTEECCQHLPVNLLSFKLYVNDCGWRHPNAPSGKRCHSNKK